MNKEQLVKYIIEGVLLVTITSFIISYLSAEAPYLTIDGVCPEKVPLNDYGYFNFKIKNYKDIDAYYIVCGYSDEFLFENLQNYFCSQEQRLLHYTEEIPWTAYSNFKVRIDLNKIDFFTNAKIRFLVTCKQKVWGIRKDCNHLDITCIYSKDNYYWVLNKTVGY